MSKLTMQIIGNVGNDAVVKQVGDKSIIEFSVAHTEKWTDKQGVKNQKTTWVKCSYWTDRVNIAAYIKKGGMIEVSGLPHITTYTTQNNEFKANLELKVTSITLISSSTQNNEQPAQQQTSAQTIPQQDHNTPDDLPF